MHYYQTFGNNSEGTVTSGGTTAPAAGTEEQWQVSTSSLIPFPSVDDGVVPSGRMYVIDPAAPSEIIRVSFGGGNQTWVVHRGAEGTTPVAHASNFTVRLIVPASYWRQLEDERVHYRVTSANQYQVTQNWEAVDALSVHLEPGGSYEIEFFLAIKSDAAADIKTRWVTSPDVTGTKFVMGPTSQAAGFTSQVQHECRMSGHALTTPVYYQTWTSVNDNHAVERALVTYDENRPTTGYVSLEFSRSDTGTGTGGIGVGSYLRWRRVYLEV